MAFDNDNLRTIAHMAAHAAGQGNTVRLHGFTTNDTLAVVLGANYWDAAAGFLLKGDMILATCDIDGTPQSAVLQVATRSATAVTVSHVTGGVVLNTDITLTDGDSGHIVVPKAGWIRSIRTVLKGGAITGADAICTFKIGTTAITGGALTIAFSGSAIGDVDSATPTALNVVAAGDVIKCTVSNTPLSARTAMVSILIES